MKNEGKLIEKKVQQQATKYMQERVCELLKVDPPTRVLFKFGKAMVLHTRSPFLDFVGTWTENGGRALHLEVKSTKEHRLPLFGKAHLTDRQCQNLFNRHAMGAAVGVLWFHQGECQLISIATLHRARVTSMKSLRWDDNGLIQVIGMDFMEALRRVYGCCQGSPGGA